MEDIELEVEMTQGDTVARAMLKTSSPSRAYRVVRRSDEEWEDIFKAFDASGLTPMEFCRRHDIPARSFYRHKATNRCMRTIAATNAPIVVLFGTWAKLKVPADISPHALTKIVRLIHTQTRGLAAAKRSTSASPPKA